MLPIVSLLTFPYAPLFYIYQHNHYRDLLLVHLLAILFSKAGQVSVWDSCAKSCFKKLMFISLHVFLCVSCLLYVWVVTQYVLFSIFSVICKVWRAHICFFAIVSRIHQYFFLLLKNTRTFLQIFLSSTGKVTKDTLRFAVWLIHANLCNMSFTESLHWRWHGWHFAGGE